MAPKVFAPMFTQVSANHLDHLDVHGRLQSMRAMTWAHAVLRRTGFTASGASKRFSPVLARGETQTNSKFMYAYLQGKRVPTRGARGKYQYDLVAEVDRYLNANVASKWLDHPLWKIFEPEASELFLGRLVSEDETPHLFSEWLLGSPIPPKPAPPDKEIESLKLQLFDDFVFVCAHHRLGHQAGYKPPASEFTEHLLPQAALLEPDFGYVEKPFLKMLNDFYIRTNLSNVNIKLANASNANVQDDGGPLGPGR